MGATIYGLRHYPLPELLVNLHSLPQTPPSVYNPIREFISPSIPEQQSYEHDVCSPFLLPFSSIWPQALRNAVAQFSSLCTLPLSP